MPRSEYLWLRSQFWAQPVAERAAWLRANEGHLRAVCGDVL